MNPIPYFDAHCDTIHRCSMAGTPLRDPELRAFYDAAGSLRHSGGHIDLERAGAFSRYGCDAFQCSQNGAGRAWFAHARYRRSVSRRYG